MFLLKNQTLTWLCFWGRLQLKKKKKNLIRENKSHIYSSLSCSVPGHRVMRVHIAGRAASDMAILVVVICENIVIHIKPCVVHEWCNSPSFHSSMSSVLSSSSSSSRSSPVKRFSSTGTASDSSSLVSPSSSVWSSLCSPFTTAPPDASLNLLSVETTQTSEWHLWITVTWLWVITLI